MSGVNVRIRILLGQEVRKSPGCEPALAKQSRNRVRVRLVDQSVVETPGYGAALAKQWREHQGMGPHWSSSGGNAMIGPALVESPGYGSALADQ
ncbi:hypothetical protein Y032_0026g1475 [Ancylostoma ceylanicum]|uniref:Uncharacterized protein n=1 Tax=Ancylostoma ceylanicum TaxID=53326 RepID=A0A016UW03_9BILA|nr:hypothetical protein Y032_0026g1475 [Ancylostoma ceylanicum]